MNIKSTVLIGGESMQKQLRQLQKRPRLIIGIFGLYRIPRRSYEDNPGSTFTPLPRNITPLGIELDPTTAANLSNTEKK